MAATRNWPYEAFVRVMPAMTGEEGVGLERSSPSISDSCGMLIRVSWVVCMELVGGGDDDRAAKYCEAACGGAWAAARGLRCD